MMTEEELKQTEEDLQAYFDALSIMNKAKLIEVKNNLPLALQELEKAERRVKEVEAIPKHHEELEEIGGEQERVAKWGRQSLLDIMVKFRDDLLVIVSSLTTKGQLPS